MNSRGRFTEDQKKKILAHVKLRQQYYLTGLEKQKLVAAMNALEAAIPHRLANYTTPFNAFKTTIFQRIQDEVTDQQKSGGKKKRVSKKSSRPGCKKSSLKKYRTRPGPPYPANEASCRGRSKRGNDGKMYKSVRARNGVYRWQQK